MGFLTKFGDAPARLSRYKDGLWAEYCRVPATNVVRLRPEDDIDEACKVSQLCVGYRSLKRTRLHSGEIVLVNGASGITGMGTVISALLMGAAHIIAVARNPVRLERVKAINPDRITTVALGQGESITGTVKRVTDGQGASVLADLAPGGIETMMECMRNLEPGGRIALIASNPEPLHLPLRYLMIRSLEFTSTTGRANVDVVELLDLWHRGLIDTRPITTQYFSLSEANEALDFIEERSETDPLWPMYAAS
jgi:threonine dehydrogenase-like Zn-dependent dehydrogenase